MSPDCLWETSDCCSMEIGAVGRVNGPGSKGDSLVLDIADVNSASIGRYLLMSRSLIQQNCNINIAVICTIPEGAS